MGESDQGTALRRVVRAWPALALWVCCSVLVACSGLGSDGVADDAGRQTPQREIRRVVIAPPAITLDHSVFAPTGRHTDREIVMRRYLQQKAAEALASAGYFVVEYDFGEAVADDEQLALLIAGIREDFRKARRTLQEGGELTTRQRKSFQAGVGKAASLIARGASADAVLLIEYLGAPEGAGGQPVAPLRSALLGLMGGDRSPDLVPADAVAMEAVLLDGVSGAPVLMATLADTAD